MSNNIEYIKEYNKTHYKRFRVYLTPEEMDELEELLDKLGISKAQFLKDAIKELKNKTITIK